MKLPRAFSITVGASVKLRLKLKKLLQKQLHLLGMKRATRFQAALLNVCGHRLLSLYRTFMTTPYRL